MLCHQSADCSKWNPWLQGTSHFIGNTTTRGSEVLLAIIHSLPSLGVDTHSLSAWILLMTNSYSYRSNLRFCNVRQWIWRWYMPSWHTPVLNTEVFMWVETQHVTGRDGVCTRNILLHSYTFSPSHDTTTLLNHRWCNKHQCLSTCGIPFVHCSPTWLPGMHV